MAVLTTSQLTFYDYKDSYSVEINPDYIIVNCDEKGISKDITEVNISYGVYCGRSRISGTAVLDLTINGEKIKYTVQNCSYNTDGSIRFSIPANIDFTNIESTHIIFSELAGGDGDTFTFDKYVQFIKAVDGASGTGLVFKVYSEDGTVFREDMDQIHLETVIIVGENSVTLSDSDYMWEYDSGSNNWVLIGNGSALTVAKNDKYALKTIRCRINYNDNPYEDYISLTDEVNVYTSAIKYFKGTNILSASDQYLVAYMALYKNGKEIDALPTNKYAPNPVSSISNGVISTDAVKEDGTNYTQSDKGTFLYFIVTDTNDTNRYSAVLGVFNGSTWNVANLNDAISQPYECTYLNSMQYDNLARSNGNEEDKLMVISKGQINKNLPINFNAYKKTNNQLVSSATENIIDLHDPIISGSPPENPVNGQLWVDTRTVPYTIKVCKYNIDGSGNIVSTEWVNSNENLGETIYTSRPSSYKVNDIWILNDGEMCSGCGPGSMLRSSMSRSKEEGFFASDWSEVTSKLTQMYDNVDQYFQFDSTNGLQIGQKGEKFYVKIDAREMGFYDNTNSNDPHKKVVSIGDRSAKIKNATIEESGIFTCQVDFNDQININNPYSETTKTSGFTWQIESNGSLSLVVMS